MATEKVGGAASSLGTPYTTTEMAASAPTRAAGDTDQRTFASPIPYSVTGPRVSLGPAAPRGRMPLGAIGPSPVGSVPGVSGDSQPSRLGLHLDSGGSLRAGPHTVQWMHLDGNAALPWTLPAPETPLTHDEIVVCQLLGCVDRGGAIVLQIEDVHGGEWRTHLAPAGDHFELRGCAPDGTVWSANMNGELTVHTADGIVLRVVAAIAGRAPFEVDFSSGLARRSGVDRAQDLATCDEAPPLRPVPAGALVPRFSTLHASGRTIWSGLLAVEYRTNAGCVARLLLPPLIPPFGRAPHHLLNSMLACVDKGDAPLCDSQECEDGTTLMHFAAAADALARLRPAFRNPSGLGAVAIRMAVYTRGDVVQRIHIDPEGGKACRLRFVQDSNQPARVEAIRGRHLTSTRQTRADDYLRLLVARAVDDEKMDDEDMELAARISPDAAKAIRDAWTDRLPPLAREMRQALDAAQRRDEHETSSLMYYRWLFYARNPDGSRRFVDEDLMKVMSKIAPSSWDREVASIRLPDTDDERRMWQALQVGAPTDETARECFRRAVVINRSFEPALTLESLQKTVLISAAKAHSEQQELLLSELRDLVARVGAASLGDERVAAAIREENARRRPIDQFPARAMALYMSSSGSGRR